jgi:hypothetical protein
MLYWRFHFEMQSQSLGCLQSGKEKIYRILDLDNEVHSIWVIWTSGLPKWRGNCFFKVWQGGQQFLIGIIKFHYFWDGLPEGGKLWALATIHPWKFVGGGLTTIKASPNYLKSPTKKMLNVLMYCIALMILSLVTWTPKTMVQTSNWSIIVNPCQNVLIINL